MAIFINDDPPTWPRYMVKLRRLWVDIQGDNALMISQHARAIDRLLGWLEYVAKHSARGVHHYQRSGKPGGWNSTGRLWGKWGKWPLIPESSLSLDPKAYVVFARLTRKYMIKQGRPKKVFRSRFSLDQKKYPPGLSEWVSFSMTYRFLEYIDSIGLDFHLVESLDQ